MASPEPGKEGTVFCRSCGKSIEAGARFCRFCGKSQGEPAGGQESSASSRGPAGSPAAPAGHRTGSSVEQRLAQLFPRHHLQDEFTHVGTIAAFLMALIGFILGFFFSYSWLGTNFLLGSIALLLFLILRESTLSHIRVRNGGSPSSSSEGGTRYHAGRRPTSATGPAEAATAESSPPGTRQPPTTPR